ncbi:hypothetical protein LDC_0809, partial [sediment metagenome]
MTEGGEEITKKNIGGLLDFLEKLEQFILPNKNFKLSYNYVDSAFRAAKSLDVGALSKQEQSQLKNGISTIATILQNSMLKSNAENIKSILEDDQLELYWRNAAVSLGFWDFLPMHLNINRKSYPDLFLKYVLSAMLLVMREKMSIELTHNSYYDSPIEDFLREISQSSKMLLRRYRDMLTNKSITEKDFNEQSGSILAERNALEFVGNIIEEKLHVLKGTSGEHKKRVFQSVVHKFNVSTTMNVTQETSIQYEIEKIIDEIIRSQSHYALFFGGYIKKLIKVEKDAKLDREESSVYHIIFEGKQYLDLKVEKTIPSENTIYCTVTKLKNTSQLGLPPLLRHSDSQKLLLESNTIGILEKEYPTIFTGLGVAYQKLIYRKGKRRLTDREKKMLYLAAADPNYGPKIESPHLFGPLGVFGIGNLVTFPKKVVLEIFQRKDRADEFIKRHVNPNTYNTSVSVQGGLNNIGGSVKRQVEEMILASIAPNDILSLSSIITNKLLDGLFTEAHATENMRRLDKAFRNYYDEAEPLLMTAGNQNTANPQERILELESKFSNYHRTSRGIFINGKHTGKLEHSVRKING